MHLPAVPLWCVLTLCRSATGFPCTLVPPTWPWGRSSRCRTTSPTLSMSPWLLVSCAVLCCAVLSCLCYAVRFCAVLCYAGWAALCDGAMLCYADHHRQFRVPCCQTPCQAAWSRPAACCQPLRPQLPTCILVTSQVHMSQLEVQTRITGLRPTQVQSPCQLKSAQLNSYCKSSSCRRCDTRNPFLARIQSTPPNPDGATSALGFIYSAL